MATRQSFSSDLRSQLWLSQAINRAVATWFDPNAPILGRGNQWFDCSLGQFYLRASTRCLPVYESDRRVYRCLDFANMTVRRPGTGVLTALLDEFEGPFKPALDSAPPTPRPYAAVYVECCTARLGKYLIRRGYRVADLRMSAGVDGTSYFKFVEPIT